MSETRESLEARVKEARSWCEKNGLAKSFFTFFGVHDSWFRSRLNVNRMRMKFTGQRPIVERDIEWIMRVERIIKFVNKYQAKWGQ